MPSPFPGMDPYLEHPDHFHNLHNRLITYIEDALQPSLPGLYFAKSTQRVWVEYGQRYIEPDVSVGRSGRSRRTGDGGGTAVLEAPVDEVVTVVLASVPDDEHTETYLEIYTGRGEDKRLVTSIEVLSPSNKTPGNEGQELYLRKQRELRASPVNLVEIDLLRGGMHVTAVPRDAAIARAGKFDYHVCVHRFDARDRYDVYPIQLNQPLPRIAIPLLPGDGNVMLDLQAVFTRCYDAGPYRREIDYAKEQPDPPLANEWTQWAQEKLRKATAAR